MSDAAVVVVGLVAAYVAGSIPTAYLAGRANGVDLRKHGSGNLGATNAWRVLGWRIGLLVYAVDTLKGSKIANLKELRFSAEGGVWRVAFAFHARRVAVLLAADKRGQPQTRFYKALIALAERRWATRT